MHRVRALRIAAAKAAGTRSWASVTPGLALDKRGWWPVLVKEAEEFLIERRFRGERRRGTRPNIVQAAHELRARRSDGMEPASGACSN